MGSIYNIVRSYNRSTNAEAAMKQFSSHVIRHTVMSNHHFKNKNLTLKAKGLLSLMLSLPDDWNYNMQGLATLSRDGIDSVRSAIKELEHHGYVERHRLRNEYGFYGDTEYIIREVPLGEEND